jgi:hypothetical protein
MEVSLCLQILIVYLKPFFIIPYKSTLMMYPGKKLQVWLQLCIIYYYQTKAEENFGMWLWSIGCLKIYIAILVSNCRKITSVLSKRCDGWFITSLAISSADSTGRHRQLTTKRHDLPTIIRTLCSENVGVHCQWRRRWSSVHFSILAEKFLYTTLYRPQPSRSHISHLTFTNAASWFAALQPQRSKWQWAQSLLNVTSELAD